MFSLASGLYQAYFAAPELTVLIVGESSSGKTCLLERMKVTQFSRHNHGKGGTLRKHSVVVEHPERVPAGVFGVQLLNETSSTNSNNSNCRPRIPDHDDIVESPFNQRTIRRPVPGRLMVTETTKRMTTSASTSESNSPLPPLVPVRDASFSKFSITHPLHYSDNKRSWLCPAPSKYKHATDDDEVEDADSGTDTKVKGGDRVHESTTILPRTGNGAKEKSMLWMGNVYDEPEHDYDPNRCSSTSLISVDLGGGDSTSSMSLNMPSIYLVPAESSLNSSEKIHSTFCHHLTPSELDSIEYDLQVNRTMLPLKKIRPTMGMNLANVNICGAKCHLQDLSGKFQNVWQNYYGDCDAVIFVFRVENTRKSNSVDNLSLPSENLTAAAQLSLLTQVRGAIADDVPFLILGHLFDLAVPAAQHDVLYSSSSLLPHYHNPLQSIFFARATTGQGVRSALEWLIPLARRQQHVRQHQHSHR